MRQRRAGAHADKHNLVREWMPAFAGKTWKWTFSTVAEDFAHRQVGLFIFLFSLCISPQYAYFRSTCRS